MTSGKTYCEQRYEDRIFLRRRKGETEYEQYKICNIPYACECQLTPAPKHDLNKNKDWQTNNTILDNFEDEYYDQQQVHH